jgi:diacylglycerol O-acyltransferase / wax synthase
MARLSSMDAIWMNAEQDGPPIAIGGLVILDGPAPTRAEYAEFVDARIAGRMRQRLVPDPMRVRQPAWEDAEPDLTKQIHELTVSAPGGDDEINAAVAQIMQIPMDPELPLWDSTIITGMPDGSWGLVTRVHHTVADGQGALLLTGRLLDVDPEGTTSLTKALDRLMSTNLASQPTSAADSPASRAGRLAEATQKGGDLVLRALKTLTSASATSQAVEAAAESATKTLDALNSHLPKAAGPFAGNPGQDRAWVLTSVSIDDVRTIRSGLGGTLNDVVMTLMSGGFARAHAQLGVAAETVRVMVPLSLRSPGDLTANNQVGALLVLLPVGGSATSRLADISEHIDSIKEINMGSMAASTQALVDRTVPAFVQTYAVSNFAGKFGEAFTETLVTNVPGPQFPIYVAGREVRVLAPVIPLGAPLRLSTGVMSYNGILHFGISGGEAMTGAVPEVAAGIQETLHELLEAARAS